MATMLVSPETRTGVGLLVVVLSPSWPNPFNPQAQTVPLSLRAIVWLYPPATSINGMKIVPMAFVLSRW